MLCKTFLIGCAVAIVGIVLSLLVCSFAQKKNSVPLMIVGSICVLLTCFGTLGIGMVQRAETNRVNQYAYAWQRELYSGIAKSDTSEEAKAFAKKEVIKYEAGYEKLHIDDGRVAPKHRRPHPRVHMEYGKWAPGETVNVYILYNNEAKSYMQKVTLK